MTAEEQLKKFVVLAAKTGRIYVAPDVYEELGKLPAVYIQNKSTLKLVRLEVVVSYNLPPGGMATIDSELLETYLVPGRC